MKEAKPRTCSNCEARVPTGPNDLCGNCREMAEIVQGEFLDRIGLTASELRESLEGKAPFRLRGALERLDRAERDAVEVHALDASARRPLEQEKDEEIRRLPEEEDYRALSLERRGRLGEGNAAPGTRVPRGCFRIDTFPPFGDAKPGERESSRLVYIGERHARLEPWGNEATGLSLLTNEYPALLAGAVRELKKEEELIDRVFEKSEAEHFRRLVLGTEAEHFRGLLGTVWGGWCLERLAAVEAAPDTRLPAGYLRIDTFPPFDDMQPGEPFQLVFVGERHGQLLSGVAGPGHAVTAKDYPSLLAAAAEALARGEQTVPGDVPPDPLRGPRRPRAPRVRGGGR